MISKDLRITFTTSKSLRTTIMHLYQTQNIATLVTPHFDRNHRRLHRCRDQSTPVSPPHKFITNNQKPCLKQAFKYNIIDNTNSQELRSKLTYNYNIIDKSCFYRLQITLPTPLPLFDLMGDFHTAKLLAPYLTAYYGAIPIIGKPQPLSSIVTHELAEWALPINANLVDEIWLVVMAGFSVDEDATGQCRDLN